MENSKRSTFYYWRGIFCLLILPCINTIVAMIPPHCWLHNTLVSITCFIVLGYIALTGRSRRIVIMTVLVMVGFCFSILGDWLMNIRYGNEKTFIAAIGLFLAAHLCFLTGFIANGKIYKGFVIVVLVLLMGYLPYYFIRLYPAIPTLSLQGAVLVYLLVSICSLTATTVVRFLPPVRTIAIMGICMIVFSDTLIAELVFVGNNKWEGLIIPTYVLTHLLLTIAIVLDHFFNELSSNCYLSSNHG